MNQQTDRARVAKNDYEVIVGNIGTVYAGHNLKAARKKFNAYRSLSMHNAGRAGGESVTMLRSTGDPIEFIGGNDRRIGDGL